MFSNMYGVTHSSSLVLLPTFKLRHVVNSHDLYNIVYPVNSCMTESCMIFCFMPYQCTGGNKKSWKGKRQGFFNFKCTMSSIACITRLLEHLKV